MTTLVLILLIGLVLFGATWLGGRQAYGAGGIEPTSWDLRQGIHDTRATLRTVLHRRCRTAPSYRLTIWEMPRSELGWRLRSRQRALAEARDRGSWCDRPRKVIRYVFPDATEDEAIRVAECESHLYPYAVGAAGERGLFQIHPVHAPWLGDLWGQLFNPLVNAQVAWRMSRRGTSWGPWTCQP